MSSRPSVIRQFLKWWFGPPFSPWVSANVLIDFSAARAYLDALAKPPGSKVSVQHLLIATVGRTLRAFPDANARIVAGRIQRQDAVNVVAPVNLLGHPAGRSRELSMAITTGADTRALRDLARDARDAVRAERTDRITNPFVRTVVRMMERSPEPLTRRALDALDRGMRNPAVAAQVYAQAPFTTALTNPGSTFKDREGLLFRGGALSLPGRLVHLGTLWGVSAVQNEVMVIDGAPAVRPALPVLLLFDHRLIDGARAGQILLRFHDILRDPASFFGVDGEQINA
ncbi:MAG: 2-oxo acid dehydrogenase subunit E2 [Myxococcota bacterium]